VVFGELSLGCFFRSCCLARVKARGCIDPVLATDALQWVIRMVVWRFWDELLYALLHEGGSAMSCGAQDQPMRTAQRIGHFLASISILL